VGLHRPLRRAGYDAAIRIPERLYEVLAERQRKTLDRFTARYGHRPAGAQRAQLALFPTTYRSHDGTVPLTHQWFYSRFRPWVDAMDLRTFLYTKPDARTAVAGATAASGLRQARDLAAQDAEKEAVWRERALNAEDALFPHMTAGG
jgi:hypothetical protein